MHGLSLADYVNTGSYPHDALCSSSVGWIRPPLASPARFRRVRECTQRANRRLSVSSGCAGVPEVLATAAVPYCGRCPNGGSRAYGHTRSWPISYGPECRVAFPQRNATRAYTGRITPTGEMLYWSWPWVSSAAEGLRYLPFLKAVTCSCGDFRDRNDSKMTASTG